MCTDRLREAAAGRVAGNAGGSELAIEFQRGSPIPVPSHVKRRVGSLQTAPLIGDIHRVVKRICGVTAVVFLFAFKFQFSYVCVDVVFRKAKFFSYGCRSVSVKEDHKPKRVDSFIVAA